MNYEEIRGLQEAYNQVYAPQEVEEVYKGKHGQSDKEYADSRSQGGKMVSGDSKQSGAEYTHGRRVKAANPGMQPDVGGKTKPKSQGKMDRGTRADIEYRKANLKKEELELDQIVESLVERGHTEQEAYALVAQFTLDEDSRRTSNKQHTARVRANIKSFGSNYTPPSNYDPDANRGQGEVVTRKQIEKKRRKALRQEDFEFWVNALVEEGYDLSDYTWDEMYEFYLDEAEKPFPYEKVTAQQKKHTAAGRYGNMMKMGLAKRRAKEAEKTGGSQRDAGKGWYHAKEEFEKWYAKQMGR
jgi:hypothetical protein